MHHEVYDGFAKALWAQGYANLPKVVPNRRRGSKRRGSRRRGSR